MKAPKIYVMERGFVLVGRPREKRFEDSLFIVLDDPAVIRLWGTSTGLGELAMKGPTDKTVLDPEPDGTRIRLTAIYREIPCNQEAWAKWPKR